MIKTYRELCRLKTFEERFKYLKLDGLVGQSIFGFDRYANQAFYQSREWRDIRGKVIVRDNGCDLGIFGREIYHRPLVHHLNPISFEDLELGSRCIFDLNNLICTSHDTHNAIHYGKDLLPLQTPIERKKGDTCPWMKASL